MAAKRRKKKGKRAARKRSRRAGPARGLVEHRGRAKKGSGGRAAEVDLAQPVPAAVARAPEAKDPRPYKSRYPVLMAEYLKLKTASASVEIEAPAESECETLTLDRGQADATQLRPVTRAVLFDEAAAPARRRTFDGIADTGWFPPDCTLAAGPSHVLASVNSSLAIYRKGGGTPLVQRTLTAWFSNLSAVSGATIFDPKALYDQYENRWVVLAVAIDSRRRRSWHLLSVSATADPQGTWRNYALDATRDGSTSTNNWADYPGLGVDPSALYVTTNQFAFNGGFRYAKLRVIPKRGPYTGGVARYWDFVRLRNADDSSAFTVQPCHHHGAPGSAYLLNSYYPSGNRLSLWQVGWRGERPTLSRRTVQTWGYTFPPDAEQQGGGTPLDSGDVRMLNAVCRGGTVWGTLTTGHRWSGAASNVAAIYWCQINPTSGQIVQQGIYGARGRHYTYPALSVDTNGNAALVFARSSRREFASLRYTGRRASEPLGQLQGSAQLRAGRANYERLDGFGRNRWGDYSGAAADADGRSIWLYGPYADLANTWATGVGSTRF